MRVLYYRVLCWLLNRARVYVDNDQVFLDDWTDNYHAHVAHSDGAGTRIVIDIFPMGRHK